MRGGVYSRAVRGVHAREMHVIMQIIGVLFRTRRIQFDRSIAANERNAERSGARSVDIRHGRIEMAHFIIAIRIRGFMFMWNVEKGEREVVMKMVLGQTIRITGRIRIQCIAIR